MQKQGFSLFSQWIVYSLRKLFNKLEIFEGDCLYFLLFIRDFWGDCLYFWLFIKKKNGEIQ